MNNVMACWKSIGPSGIVRYIPHRVTSQHRWHRCRSHPIHSLWWWVMTNTFFSPAFAPTVLALLVPFFVHNLPCSWLLFFHYFRWRLCISPSSAPHLLLAITANFSGWLLSQHWQSWHTRRLPDNLRIGIGSNGSCKHGVIAVMGLVASYIFAWQSWQWGDLLRCLAYSCTLGRLTHMKLSRLCKITSILEDFNLFSWFVLTPNGGK